jgi:hypothetical protein
MKFVEGNLYHVYNQGNNGRIVFRSREDYIKFLWLTKELISAASEIICYCLLPDQFSFMLYADERCHHLQKQGGLLLDPITNGIRKLLSGYARVYNQKYQQSGSVFRQKTKAKCLSDPQSLSLPNFTFQDYGRGCFIYIHQLPFKTNLVKKLEDWEFSSFMDYAGLRNGKLCNREIASRYCAYDTANFLSLMNESIPHEILAGLFVMQ